MALLDIHRESAICDKQVDLRVIVPEVGEPPYPCLYLLHGLTGDSRSWLRSSRLEFHLRELPLMVVLPDGYRSWYTRDALGVDYGRYVAEETVEFVERFLPANGRRSIAGLSMGGYGALRLAFRWPGRFRSASSHSGALIPWERDPAILSAAEQTYLFGSQPAGSEHDLLASAALAAPELAVRFDCGLEDEAWIGINRRVHAELRHPHAYREYSGGHDWNYWEARLPEILRFHLDHL